MKYIALLLFFITCHFLHSQTPATSGSGQKIRLCQEYYKNGEYEKAAQCFLELHEQDKSNDYLYEKLLSCYHELEDWSNAEKIIKKAIKSNPEKLQRLIDIGIIFEKQKKNNEAKENFEKALKMLSENQLQIMQLAQAFTQKKKYDYALQTYQKGEKLIKETHFFAYEMAELYHLKGDVEKMIESYLNALDFLPTRLTNIQAYLQRYLPEMTGNYEALKKQLYLRIQKNSSQILYPELLIWIYIQDKNFEEALEQSIALDRRLDENGTRIYKLAQMALNENAYDAAILCFQYIIDAKGPQNLYYIESRQALLNTQKTKLSSDIIFDKNAITQLCQSYEQFLSEFKKGKKTATVISELSDLYAYYLHDFSKAIQLMNEVLEIPLLDKVFLAESKLKLGDFYLMSGEVWESTLLYSQVDKEMKDAPQGENARYKNAKLSYYKGDFDWAQEQLDVLKGASSELIANDAIDVSVFIMDHVNLDTTHASMKYFAEADLLLFQNKISEAFLAFDSLLVRFPNHGLGDDVYLSKAKIYLSKKDFDQALFYLEKITTEYKEGILVDNAIFKMAEIYEMYKKDNEKAMKLYESILFDFPGSIFTVESRKRFRRLRGDGA